MSRRYERNALSNKRWNHMNDELVDLALVDERPNKFRTTDHPDVLSALGAERFCDLRYPFADELHARRDDQSRRIAREDVVLWSGPESRSVLEAELVRLAPKNNRIDRPAERTHAVVASCLWTAQPIDAAVSSTDEAVGARRSIDNTLPHSSSLPKRYPTYAQLRLRKSAGRSLGSHAKCLSLPGVEQRISLSTPGLASLRGGGLRGPIQVAGGKPVPGWRRITLSSCVNTVGQWSTPSTSLEDHRLDRVGQRRDLHGRGTDNEGIGPTARCRVHDDDRHRAIFVDEGRAEQHAAAR